MFEEYERWSDVQEQLHNEEFDDHFPLISHSLFSDVQVEDEDNFVENLPMFQIHYMEEFPRNTLGSFTSLKSLRSNFTILGNSLRPI